MSRSKIYQVSKLLLSAVLAVSTCLLLNVKVFDLIPPISPLFSPIHGLWQNLQEDPFPLQKKFYDLKSSVFVFRDKQGIYHLNSESSESLAFVQGWVSARERLWQMEFLSRVGLGETAEVIGPKTIEIDKLMIRSGMRQAVNVAKKVVEKDPEILARMTAYAAGVNSYIKELEPQNFPPEYKFFSTRPREWKIEYSLAVVKLMALQLSGNSTDLQMSRVLRKISKEQLEEFYPIYTRRNIPIIGKKEFPKNSLEIPEAPGELFQASEQILEYLDIDPDSGSNAWAVAPAKTKRGYSIVANDTHLGFNLPSVWQMIQLTGPDYNVFGASLTGTPGVVIGHTTSAAWAFTNSPIDVLDWYEVRLNSEKTHYIYDGKEQKLKWIEEPLMVRGREKQIERIPWTHHGPIVFPLEDYSAGKKRYPRGAAMKWAGHSSSFEIRAIEDLNRAKTLADCERAIQNFSNPPQNIICADSQNVSLTVRGKMPVKWSRQGMSISDGTDPKYEWSYSVPIDEMPHEKNPSKGFVSSANNHSTYSDYPYYLNFRYDSSYRNGRIHELLKEGNEFTVTDMIKMQSDTKNTLAADAVPLLMSIMSRWENKSEFEEWVLDGFRFWNFQDGAESVMTTVFLHWFGKVEKAAWAKLGPSRSVILPREPVLLELLGSRPGDLLWESEKEPQQIVRDLLSETASELTSRLGKNRARWHWGLYKSSKIPHVSRIPGWGSKDIFIGGSNETILSHKGFHGPNWRYVVELDEEGPNSWAIFAGGTSGNPMSKNYDFYLDKWKDGELVPIRFLKPEEWESLPVSRLEPL